MTSGNLQGALMETNEGMVRTHLSQKEPSTGRETWSEGTGLCRAGWGAGRTVPGRYKEPKAGSVRCLRNGEKSHVAIAKWKSKV